MRYNKFKLKDENEDTILLGMEHESHFRECFIMIKKDLGDEYIPKLDKSKIIEVDGDIVSRNLVIKNKILNSRKVKRGGFLSAGDDVGNLEFRFAPCSLNFVKENIERFSEIIDGLKKHRYYPGSNCGIHIHVSEKNYSDKQLVSLFKFFEENIPFIIDISDRELSNGYANTTIIEFKKNTTPIYGGIETVRRNYRWNNNCIRLNSCFKTIEFRMFKSTFNINKILSNMEFIHSLTSYINLHKDEKDDMDLELETFVKYISLHKDKYNNFYNTLRKRDYLAKDIPNKIKEEVEEINMVCE